MSGVVVLSSLAATGCASAAPDPETVDDSVDALTAHTPASTAAFEGESWVATSSAAHDGDILALRLYTDGSYVRLRCYGSGCAQAVAETDRFTAFRSRGKTYVAFDSFVRVLVPPPPAKAPPPGVPAKPAAGPEWDNSPVVADTYEIRSAGGGIKLRKTYASRWTNLVAVDDPTLCNASGGTWSPAASAPVSTAPKTPPTTKGQQPAQPPPVGAPPVTVAPLAPDAWMSCQCAAGERFVGGAGGCMHIATADESACDASNGSYTDDDATKLGTFCACGLGRTLVDTGCVDL